MKIFSLALVAGFCLVETASAFGVAHNQRRAPTSWVRPTAFELSSSSEGAVANSGADEKFPEDMSAKDKEKVIGNLVAEDEWNGLTMELSELVRLSVVEGIKKNTRDFIGKDEYKMGDIIKEADSRVKKEVAKLRGKEEYELGDLALALDKMSKEMTCELTGKEEYELGDLGVELDKRIKAAVADFCGKEGDYEVGDLRKEIKRRVKERVTEFTGHSDFEFGDISREINKRRQKWVSDYLGEEAASRYQFGDVTKKMLSDYLGKDDYQFGDLTKKFVGDLFAGKKKKGGDS